MQWLNATLESKYDLVRVWRDTPQMTMRQLRHKALGRDLMCLSFEGDGAVYRLLQTVRHPHLPRIYEVRQEGNRCLVLEEYLSGSTVAQILENGLYTEDGVRRVMAAVCEGVGFLHRYGYIHRDIKPENVMVCDDGRVVLLDFDIAREYKPHARQDTCVIGTAGYAAPEQFGVAQTDTRSDLFAMGVMMNVMLTGQHPTRQAATGKLAPIIEKCTQLDPNKRYADVWELKERLLY